MVGLPGRNHEKVARLCEQAIIARDELSAHHTMQVKGVVDYFAGGSSSGSMPAIGDTAVFPLVLPQMFMNRCYVPAVSGISRNTPMLEGLFDSATNELNEDFEPISTEVTREKVKLVGNLYAMRSLGA